MNDVRLLIMVDRELINTINEYRFANKIDSESEAVRRLILKGLQISDEEIEDLADIEAIEERMKEPDEDYESYSVKLRSNISA
ncbi:MAG: hypothetical protein HQL03_15815 [Nitrospirae bacterium]|nr:hypothetical protein [Nitrospirota bacterium]MBF0593300.1 hypothetical protein [Nitrospirota bacterium]